MRQQDKAFDMYAESIYNAAIMLSQYEGWREDERLQCIICSRYGLFLDNMTDDEIKLLYKLAEEFEGG